MPTHNGVIQGSINSPWLFALYLEYFLFSNPKVKAMCDAEDLLAFADDLYVLSRSWKNLRKELKELTDALTPGFLLFNNKKPEIMTTRNRNQPTDISDWQTDAEDNVETEMEIGESVQAHNKKKKAKGSSSNPICIDVFQRRNGDKDVPRTKLEDFCGI